MSLDEERRAQRTALARNPALVCVFHAVHMALFPIAVITLFLRDDLGLSMFDIFLLQAIFGLAIALLEFPGGYVADRLGYRPSLAVGALCASLGWVFYAAADSFLVVAVGEVIMAAGIALISGVDTALMYESLLALDEEETYTRWFSRYRFLGNVSEGTAALVGALMYAHWARLPLVVQTLLWAGNAWIALQLVEPPRDAGVSQPARQRAVAILRFAALEAPRLRVIIALFLALSLPTYVMVWILPAYALDAGVAVAYMGPIWAGASYLVGAASLAAPWVRARLGLSGGLLLCVLLVGVGYLGLGLSHALYGFLFYGALCIVRGVQMPLLQHEEQRAIPSSDRASLSSLKSLAFRASFVGLGPAVGYALDRVGHHEVLLALALPFTMLALAAWAALRWSPAPTAPPLALPRRS